MKRVIGIILCIAVLICSPVTYYGQKTDENIYKTIDVEFSDNVGTTEAIQIMIENDHLYVNAEQIGQRLGYSVQVGDGYVSIYNKKTSDTIPYGATKFNFDSLEISHMLFNRTVNYEAEFESRKNEQGAWIPFQQSLLLLNSSVLVVDNKFLIEMPHKNIIDIFMDITRNSNTYLFDWNKDFGYTDANWISIGAASHMVNVLNGFLDLDGASWAQLVQTLMLRNDAYDDKYGQAIAKLFCTYSDKELREQVEEMKGVMQHFDGSGTFGKTLKALEKEIPSDAEIGQLQKTCETLKNEIYAGNGNAAKYDVSYQILERAVDDANRFDDTLGVILEAQRPIGDITDKLYTWAEVVGYASEFDNQDKFAVDALENFVSKIDSSDTMSNQMKNSIKNYEELLKTDIVTYSALTWLQNNFDKHIFDAMDLDAVLGTEASLVLVAWDFAKDLNVLGLGDKIDAADKFELAVYASIFQSDAFINYQEVREQTFSDEGNITPENLYSVSQLCYAYLKSCYITRDAALASLKAKSTGVQEKIKPLTDEQNAINESIAKYLIKLKNANKDNSKLCYGFLPGDNETFLKENDESLLVNKIRLTDYEDAYKSVIDRYIEASQIEESEWFNNQSAYEEKYQDLNIEVLNTYHQGTHSDEVLGIQDEPCVLLYTEYDIDGNGVPELIIGRAIHELYTVDIYSFDGNSAVRLFEDDSATYYIYTNGLIEQYLPQQYQYYKLDGIKTVPVDNATIDNDTQLKYQWYETLDDWTIFAEDVKGLIDFNTEETVTTDEVNNNTEENKSSIMSAQEICEKVQIYYNSLYNTDKLVVFDSEYMETDDSGFVLVRTTEGNSANELFASVDINLTTGDAVDDLGNSWNLYSD